MGPSVILRSVPAVGFRAVRPSLSPTGESVWVKMSRLTSSLLILTNKMLELTIVCMKKGLIKMIKKRRKQKQ